MIHNGQEIDKIMFNGQEISDAQYNGESLLAGGILQALGISMNDVAFFISSRKGRSGVKEAYTVRRSSDSKNTVIPFRPYVDYNTPRNELHYDPVTWSEWATSEQNPVDYDGITIPSTSVSAITLTTNLKPATKYGALYEVVENTSESSYYIQFTSSHGGHTFVNPGQTGILKTVSTTPASITTNYLKIGRNYTLPGYIKIRNARVFELPLGSQIEADFTNLTAEQLNAKYPFVGANGAPHNAPAGRPKDRICNQFPNGDGRYGSLGWVVNYGSAAPISGGIRITGNGTGTNILSYVSAPLSLFCSDNTKYYIRALVKRDAAATAVRLEGSNGNGTYPNLTLTSQTEADKYSWIHGIITFAEAGATGKASLYLFAQYADSAIQNGKAFDVRYVSAINMGDNANSLLFNKSAEEMDAWGRAQIGKGAVAVEGSWYLLPYGLMSGEEDLDIKAVFGGASALYLTELIGQNYSGPKLLPRTLPNGVGNDDYVQKVSSDLIIGKDIIVSSVTNRAKYTRANIILSNMKAGTPNLIDGIAVVQGWEESIYDTVEAGGTVDKFFTDTQLRFGFPLGTTLEQARAVLDGKVVRYQLATPIRLNRDAWQTTAASQHKVWDNGINYPGLGLLDGSDDYLVADLPDIKNGPVTFWARIRSIDTYGWLFSRIGAEYTQIQYGIVLNNSTEIAGFLEGSKRVVMPYVKGKDVIFAYTWNGQQIIPYLIDESGVVAGAQATFTGELTTWPNCLIGCTSTSADGSAKSVYYQGESMEMGIVKKVLTPDQLLKLWRR